MLQRIFTWTILAAIWKRYGKVLKVLPLLLAGIFIISFIHSDYVRYVEVSEDQSLLRWSFVIKWGLILAVVAWYWYFVKSSLTTRKGITSKKTASKKTEAKEEGDTGFDSAGEQSTDPFSDIRSKEKLRTKAELILEKKQNPS